MGDRERAVAVGRLVGDAGFAAHRAGGEALREGGQRAVGRGGGGQRAALDRAEEGVEVGVEAVGTRAVRLGDGAQRVADAALELDVAARRA